MSLCSPAADWTSAVQQARLAHDYAVTELVTVDTRIQSSGADDGVCVSYNNINHHLICLCEKAFQLIPI